MMGKACVRKMLDGRMKRLLILVLLAAFARLPAAEDTREQAGAAEGPDAVRVILKAEKEATLSLEVAGRITRIHRRLGESFAQGDVLIEIDDTQYAAAVDKARAVCAAAERVLAATKELAGRREVPQMELATAERDRDVARAELAVAEKNLRACRIPAPFAGRVLQLMVREHELVNAASPVIGILSNADLYAQFLLPEEYYRRISAGQRIPLQFAAPVGAVSAAVVRVSPAFDPLSHTFELHATVENPQGLLQAGMSGWFRLESLPPPALPALSPARPAVPPTGVSP